MKRVSSKVAALIYFFVSLTVLFGSNVSAQKSKTTDDKLPPRELIKTVYREAKSVVKVKVDNVASEKFSDAYRILTITGTVLKSYKGNIKAGQKLSYTVFTESKLGDEKHDERIAFLVRKKDGAGKLHWSAVETGEFVASAKLEKIVDSVSRRK